MQQIGLPQSVYHLFEPLAQIRPEYRKGLEHVTAHSNATVHPIGLGTVDGTATLAVYEGGVGSSFIDSPNYSGIESRVQVPVRRLDSYRAEKNLPPPDLVKMDVQGWELEVLKGAEETIRSANLLVLETWLYRGYGEKTVLLHELIEWLEPRGFIANHVGAPYRGEHGKLFAVDALFLREGGAAPEWS